MTQMVTRLFVRPGPVADMDPETAGTAPPREASI